MPPFHFVSVAAFSSPPPATLAARGGVLTLVPLVIAPALSFNRLSSSRPPAMLAVHGRVLTVVCLFTVLAFPYNYFSSRFRWLLSLAVQSCGIGF